MMSDERRYSGAEIERIFERAAELAESPGGGRAEGMTLRQLQEIGREVGLPAHVVAEAALAVDAGGAIRRTYGLPLDVGLEVPLPRAPSPAEWEEIVADLQSTFRARGRTAAAGRVSHWRNGNLQATVEPVAGDAYRLRLSTTKGSARPMLGAGVSLLGMAVILLALTLVGVVGDPEGVLFAGFMGLFGLGQLASAVLPLPRWSRERRAQMRGVAERIVHRLGAPSTA